MHLSLCFQIIPPQHQIHADKIVGPVKPTDIRNVGTIQQGSFHMSVCLSQALCASRSLQHTEIPIIAKGRKKIRLQKIM